MFDTVARVTQLAKERGVSMTELAVASGMNRSTFCMTIRRGGQFKVDTVERICNALHISLAEFFTLPPQNDSAAAPAADCKSTAGHAPASA